jgi:DNA ligase 1
MRFQDLVSTSAAVAATSSRLDKTSHLARLLGDLSAEEIPIAVAFLSGFPRQGKIGVGGSRAFALDVPPAPEPMLTIADVDEALAEIGGASGKGSAAGRASRLRRLLGRATRDEQEFLIRLLIGELRQGALAGVLLDAVARAAHIGVADIRRAAMLAGDLGEVARAALIGGPAALAPFTLQVMRPVDPMLADSAASIIDALRRLGRAAFEWKLDGARVQIHKSGDDVRVFSRNLRDVTAAVPEVVAVLRELPVRQIILDGEVIALRADGTPQPFQITMRRFGRRLDVERMRDELPVTPFFFDCLLADEAVLVDQPQTARFEALCRLLPPQMIVPHRITDASDQAQAFLDAALARGHEGVMAKALDSPYAAGRRGQSWLKIKQARTLDLVVLAAEWGHGRRHGWLSNLHLGARNEARGGFIMLGKTFKGLTDEMLAWQTERLLALETHRDRYTVYVRPELVVEIAFNDVQQSPQYPGGLALRFARVKGYRPDRSATDADPFTAVQQVYRQQTGLEPPGAANADDEGA